MRRFAYMVLYLCILCVTGAYAQNEREQVSAQGEQLFQHTIEQGQTVYSIATMYGVSVDDIYRLNPGSKEQIKSGEILLIPQKQHSKENTTEKKDEPTTETSTEKKETTTAAKDETTETTTEDKKTTETTTEEKSTTEAAEETSTTGKKEETDEVEEDGEKDKNNAEETTTEAEEKTTEASDEETIPAELTYDDENVTVTVSAVAEGAIPADATLKVVPILKDNTETQAQYAEVEAKIQEKAAETETEIKGFLAYDITFVDADGNEVEPNSEVKVSMEYKEAALPAEITAEDAEDAEVSVMHLEEDDAGNVSEVVDMGEAGKVDTLETTDAKQVEKVEVKTESFSVFTIQWGKEERSPHLDVHVVDAEGRDLLRENRDYQFDFEEEEKTNVNIIASQIKSKGELELKFNKAVYVPEGKEFSFFSTRVYGLNHKEDGFYYTKNSDVSSSSGWSKINKGTIYFIFGNDLNLSTVGTVSTKDKGIKINLFDYQVGSDGKETVDLSKKSDPGLSQGINKDKVLKFVSSKGSGNQNININQTGGSGYLNQGMVQNTLIGGFPKLSANGDHWSGEEKQSLNYLFDTTPSGSKSVYENLDYLFQKDADGYYTYNSDSYYAYLKKNGTEFGSTFTAVNAGNVGFYPFTNPEESGNLDHIKEASNEATLGSTGVNHYFGMTISAGFLQPAGGQIQTENGSSQDMIFEFSGDDDVWVFIDDVLVLDLGGIHAAVSGKINFSDGNIYIKDVGKNSYTPGGNIKSKFQDAGKVNSQEFTNNTFANNTNHTIKFFYLERGNSDSNCMIRFNFPTVPEDSVTVAKEVVNEQGSVDYAEDIDFQFNIKKENDEGDLVNYSGEYTIYEGSEEIGSGTTGSNGNFTLKHNQMAVFEGFLATDKYQVTETGAFLNGYEVKYNDTESEVSDGNPDSSGQTIYSATTGKLIAETVKSVRFQNSVENTTALNITKQFADSSVDNDTDKEFQVYVEFQGKPFNGTYGKEGVDIPLKAQNGIIYLKANETAKISGLPYGTSFEVYEIQDGSYIPSYAVTGSGIYDSVLPNAENEVYSVSGKVMNQNQDSVAGTITVTNTKVEGDSGKTSVTVHKEWDEIVSDDLLPPYVTVTLYKDVDNDGELNNTDTPVIGSDGNYMSAQLKGENWSYTWDNLEPDVNYVVKEEYPPGYKFLSLDISNTITNLNLYSEKNAPNKVKTFQLKDNSLLLVKPTGSTGEGEYILWSPINLNLLQTEINKIVEQINNSLTGSGSIGNKGVTYQYGDTSLNGVTLTNNQAEGWTLQFAESCTWSLFWAFQYDRTQTITLTNTLDTDYKISIDVTKVWEGDHEQNRPESVTVQLFKNESLYKEEVVILKTDNWKHTFTGLPYYNKVTDDNGNITGYIKNIYTVKEIKIGDIEVDDSGQAAGYKSTVTGNQDGGFVITNVVNEQWRIVKKSSSVNDNGTHLDVPAGAKFTLTGKTTEGTLITYSGEVKEGPDGVITWEDENKNPVSNDAIPGGTYTLTETKAPTGYALSTESWTLTFDYQGAVPTVKKGQDNYEVKGVKDSLTGITTYTFIFENTAIYSLPSAGGPGIYWYTFSGTLLMAGAALIVYRQKRKREVLLRK